MMTMDAMLGLVEKQSANIMKYGRGKAGRDEFTCNLNFTDGGTVYALFLDVKGGVPTLTYGYGVNRDTWDAAEYCNIGENQGVHPVDADDAMEDICSLQEDKICQLFMGEGNTGYFLARLYQIKPDWVPEGQTA